MAEHCNLGLNEGPQVLIHGRVMFPMDRTNEERP